MNCPVWPGCALLLTGVLLGINVLAEAWRGEGWQVGVLTSVFLALCLVLGWVVGRAGQKGVER